MKHYLGVDAGGSKTYAMITNELGEIVGKGHSGNGNHQINYDEARANIGESVRLALHQAGLDPGGIESACFGLAGADRPVDFSILRPMIGELGFAKYDIVCDTMIAMRAGTSRSYGVVLICGSGTNSAGRNRQGEDYQCGGFDYQFGDFGGGWTLAVEAFRSVIRAWDGRERPTLLTGLLLEYLGYDSVLKMFNDYLDNGKSVPVDVTKLIFQAAGQGDEVALAILRRQGEELGKSACAVIERLNMREETFDIVLAGSVVTKGEGPYITDCIRAAVRGLAPNASLLKLRTEPVIGALWMAMEAEGTPLNRSVYERLSQVTDYHDVHSRT